jgi:predicted nucleic acid-binding protein
MCSHFKEKVMNITLSVDEQVAARAREAAQKLGKSLNQVVRDYLEQLAGSARRGQQWAQFEQLCLQSNAQLDLYEQFEVVQVTPAVIRAGLDLHQTRSVAFYDALIIASASIAGCNVLYSEDLNAGETMAGVGIVNPFMAPIQKMTAS